MISEKGIKFFVVVFVVVSVVIYGIAWVILSSSIGQVGTTIVPICPVDDPKKVHASDSNSASFS
jgi:hypothetical protein